MVKNYGKELIIDLHNCNVEKFNRKSLKIYFKEICNLIEMQRAKLVFWDDVGVPENKKQTKAHTKGTTAVQFILTSNIIIHTLDIKKSVYVNIFSCKDFNTDSVREFTIKYFNGELKHWEVCKRV